MSHPRDIPTDGKTELDMLEEKEDDFLTNQLNSEDGKISHLEKSKVCPPEKAEEGQDKDRTAQQEAGRATGQWEAEEQGTGSLQGK